MTVALFLDLAVVSLTQYSLASADLHSDPVTSHTESLSTGETDSKSATSSNITPSTERTMSTLEEGTLTPSDESQAEHGMGEAPGE